MRLYFAVFAESGNFTRTNNVNLLGIFPVLQAHSLPAAHKHMTFVFEIAGEEADFGTFHDLTVTLKRPNKKQVEILLEGHSMEFPRKKPTSHGLPYATFMLEMNDFGLTGFGDHIFTILVDGKEVGSQILPVVKMTETMMKRLNPAVLKERSA